MDLFLTEIDDEMGEVSIDLEGRTLIERGVCQITVADWL